MQYIPRAGAVDERACTTLAHKLGVTLPTARVLVSRGYDQPDKAHAFFAAADAPLHDPLLLLDMHAAAERVRRALRSGERIVVYGDYDVDGVCATALLVSYLREVGGDAHYYIPARHTQGYGLHADVIRTLAPDTALLITVDCGISNSAEIALAAELGMDVVVTDHHECAPELPPCCAVVNPRREGQAYPCADLCGAGVALKLVQALGGEPAAQAYLDLAALATVADIVALTGENRTIVARGLQAMRTQPRPGIAALCQSAQKPPAELDAQDLGFVLGPRINAGGRLDLSAKSVELLLQPTVEACHATALELEHNNTERRHIEDQILREAQQCIEAEFDFERDRAIVLYRAHWNVGVIGIVASRLAQRYARVVMLLGAGEGACYGSGRSVPGVHLYRALQACDKYFIRYGGHAQAAGCAIAEPDLPAFTALLNAHLREAYADTLFMPHSNYDCTARLAELSLDTARELERLEPCGMGNPQARFLLTDVAAQGWSRMGAQGQHLRVTLEQEGLTQAAVAFGKGEDEPYLSACARFTVTAAARVNAWQGRRSLQLVADSITPDTGAQNIEALLGGARALQQGALALRFIYGARQAAPPPLSWDQGVQAIAERLHASPWGALVLCLREQTARALLLALDEQALRGRYCLCLGDARPAQRRENAIVLAAANVLPDARRYSFLALADGGDAPGYASHAASLLQNDAPCIIIKDKPSAAELSGLGGVIQREAMGEAWRALQYAAAHVLPHPQGPLPQTARLSGLPLWRLQLAAAVFSELGMLHLSEQAPCIVTDGSRRRNLDDSATMRRIQTYLQHRITGEIE